MISLIVGSAMNRRRTESEHSAVIGVLGRPQCVSIWSPCEGRVIIDSGKRVDTQRVSLLEEEVKRTIKDTASLCIHCKNQ